MIELLASGNLRTRPRDSCRKLSDHLREIVFMNSSTPCADSHLQTLCGWGLARSED